MPDLTPRIGIKKPLGNENVSRASFNENWDIIDAKVATLGLDGKVPADQLTRQNVFSSVSGKTGGTLTTVVADGPSDTLTIEGQGLIQVTTDAATDTIIVNTTAEVNQNAFANVNVNGALLTADYKSDQLNVFPGTGISVSANSPNNSLTISLDVPSTWTNLTLQNGATVYATGSDPQYKKIGNVVYMQGAVKGLTGASTQVATLPTGFRPSQTVSFALPTTNVSGANFARWSISPAGGIVMESISSGGSTANTSWYPMTMSFVVD